MISVCRFRLADVLDLAEHAVAAAAYADPVDDEPVGPALLLHVDDRVYLTSNGLPPPPGANTPGESTLRALFAEHAGHDRPRLDEDDLLIAIPLCQPGARLVEQFRAAASNGHTALVITVIDGTLGLSTVTMPTPFDAPHAD